MGIGDFISDITPDSVENAVESGTEWLGDRVEDAGNWTADRLDDVGWQSGADWVRENSRSLANQMGAQVDELQLGETEDKTKLVYGSPDKLRSLATNLRSLGESFTGVGNGLKGLDSAHLKGAAADAFRDTVSIEPPKWFKAADAFGRAAGALDQFAGTVAWAQGQAQAAIDKFKEGMRASDAFEQKVNAYNDAVDRYNAQPAESRDPSSLPPKPGSTNPGIALLNEAQEILGEARRQRDSAADTAAATVRAARDAAPPKPSYGEQAMDGLAELPVMNAHVGAGIIKGTAGIVSFARALNPADPYNLTHPAEYVTSLNSTVAGLVQVANDPWGAGRQMVTDFMKDPAEGFGRLLPDLALTAATGGAGAGVKGIRLADDLADAATARRLLDDVPGGHHRPDSHRCTNGTDPVDLATGRMFLPQTDLTLPGVLPLEFTRRVESGWTLGRFFGPSWSSTVDERLLVDALGVVHVTADGRLLTYPHPVPGIPTAAEEGASAAVLERSGTGDYRLTDPDSGLTKYFLAPSDSSDNDAGTDGTAWLTETADRNGNRITVDRTDDGTPLALVHSGGHHLRLVTDGGRVTALHLADHLVVRYGYDPVGDLATVTKPSGGTTVFTYDDKRRVTRWTDSNGTGYSYTYDTRHRVTAEGGDAGHFQLTLDHGDPDPATGHRVTALTTAAGHTTRHLIDDRCNVLATTDPLGHTTAYTHDPRGRLLTSTDPLGRTTALERDPVGRITAVTRPDGSRQVTEYDATGLPVRLTGADGTTWRQEYDARGNRTAVTDPAGHTTAYTYDDRGRLTAVTDARGAVTAVRCDPAGLPLEISAPGAVTRYARDPFGRPLTITDPLGGVTTLEWTPEGRPARRSGPDGASETWTYDGEGNCTAHTDAAGHTTRFEYTHFDLLAARTGPDGARYEFRHDAELRLTQVTDPQGLTWTYTYDAAGRLTSETDFDGRTLGYEVDAAGQLTARTTALGDVIRLEHDALGRVTRKDAAGAITTYDYDAAGRLLHAAAPDSELLYQYDRLGRVKTELVDGRALTYRYDETGRPTRRTTPSGHTTTYTYDAAGHRTGLTTGGRRIDITRDAAGRETRRDIGDTLTLTSTRDPAGRLTGSRLTAGDRTVTSRTYTYRPDGHLTAVDDALRGPRRFGLDPVGRVTAVTARNWTETYAYDAAGNVSSAQGPPRHAASDGDGDRSYTGTRVEHAGANRYTYDAGGRLIRRTRTRLSRKPDVWQYTYDAENQLTGVTTPDGTRWRYRYDPLGRRTLKQRLTGDDVTEETRFTWAGATLCEQTTGGPDPVATTWDHEGTIPLAQTERRLDGATQREIDARFFAIVTDLIGTPTELITETGDPAWRTRTTLWGTTTWNRDATAYTPLRFPGQYYDPETGLHYNHHRYYDPVTARFTTPDPLGLAPAPNPTAYVHNPHTWADLQGLAPTTGHCGTGSPAALEPARREPPNLPGTPITSRIAAPGEEFNMVISRGQPPSRPGGFGTFDTIPDQRFVREQLAIRSDWKPDVSLVQRYRVPDDGTEFRIQESVIGPQTDPNLGHLPGGGTQLEILNPADRSRLIPVGDPVEIPK
ncbi:hypothetical protein SRB5_63840 [Streptomyces sp. RB5]|uniref:Type IV secretion protein Rhs n=1 Tax=Streptomyces smaragdinus TaxID=2585196 RepID=A0A7K0CRS5_9ACTN|nr:RHS repeat-associated core domain-containing protein [Streptomyces smaragdinus]MQY16188.1 hypothetical protein [Streptomyces smaragdinus]